jgi:hypothetical protein
MITHTWNNLCASSCRNAVKLNKNIASRSLELRATISRARLLAKRNKRDEALLSLSL